MADEAISNIRTVRAFAMEDAEVELVHEELEKSQRIHSILGLGIGGFQVREALPPPSRSPRISFVVLFIIVFVVSVWRSYLVGRQFVVYHAVDPCVFYRA